MELRQAVIQYNYRVFVDEHPPREVSARSISYLPILPRFRGCPLHSKSLHLCNFCKDCAAFCKIPYRVHSAVHLTIVTGLLATSKCFSNYFYDLT